MDLYSRIQALSSGVFETAVLMLYGFDFVALSDKQIELALDVAEGKDPDTSGTLL